MTIEQVAERLGVPTRTIRSWIAAGELRSVNLSVKPNSWKRRIRIVEGDLEKFLQQQESKSAEKNAPCRTLPPVERFV
jgi:excisionase family DNA binding protein